jgi:prepilin-type N-terminal cleavage/methylation domain-containing protein
MSSAGERGFTLVEALVAMVVMSLAIVTLAAATSQALRVEAATLDHLTAAALADARMSEIAALPIGGLERLAPTRTGRFGDGNERFSWTATVTRVPDSPHLFRTLVRVSWPTGSVEIASVVHREARLGSGEVPWEEGP